MRKQAVVLIVAGITAACSSSDIGPNAPTETDRQNEVLATQKAMCRIENQARCIHVIENRTLMARFFTAETQGGMEEEEKIKGRRLTTRFVVEAAAAIKQCQPVTQESVILLRDIKIAGGTYLMKATKPVNESSACFITPDPEAP